MKDYQGGQPAGAKRCTARYVERQVIQRILLLSLALVLAACGSPGAEPDQVRVQAALPTPTLEPTFTLMPQPIATSLAAPTPVGGELSDTLTSDDGTSLSPTQPITATGDTLSLPIATPEPEGVILFLSSRDHDPQTEAERRKSAQNRDLELYAMKPDGSRQTRLSDGNQRWWNGGAYLTPYHKPNQVVINEKYVFDLPTRRVVEELELEFPNTEPTIPFLARFPAWSPDGKIYFFGHKSNESSSIYYLDEAQGEPYKLTSPPDDVWGDAWPVLSPDGEWIAFYRNWYDEAQNGIWLMRPDGSEAHRILDMEVRRAFWSPDGSKLAFEGPKPDATTFSFEVWVSAADGSHPQQLTTFPEGIGAWEPKWSPDGQRIVFNAGESARGQVFVIRADGGEPQQLTIMGDANLAPLWLPLSLDDMLTTAQPTPIPPSQPGLSEPPPIRTEGNTGRVSVATDGEQANGRSGYPTISADGRYVAFNSWASNLVSGDTNDWADVFVYDRQTGQTSLVSVDSDGRQGNRVSGLPFISADGRYVAFDSNAINLVGDDTNNSCDKNGNPANNLAGIILNCRDVFVHDRQTRQTSRVSVASDGTQGNGSSGWASISADGRYVAFYSEANNLVSGDTNGGTDVFVHDRQTRQTSRVSVASDGTQGNAPGGRAFVAWAGFASISADGRYVAFWSVANNLVSGDTNDIDDVFVHDRQTRQTSRVSIASDGTQGNRRSGWPSISADGRYVAFWSEASNLVSDDTNGVADVFVHDRKAGTTTRVSVASDGAQGNERSSGLSISADGRYVAFWSVASTLVNGDTNGRQDVFIHDRETGWTSRVSVASDGARANDWSGSPSISADGRFVAFESVVSNLVSGDTNNETDILVYFVTWSP